MYEKYFKRVFDLVFASFLLLIALPVMLLVSLIIKMEDSKGPVVFQQRRIGKNNVPFTIMKFRSMKTIRVKNGIELADDERMLRSGNIIRKLSLDELPQLINVIKGEMSFIGPRPLPVIYYPYYTEKELERHNVTPGISGLAQVNGRNNLSWDDKFKYDIYYVENIGFKIDIRIVVETILKVFKRADVKVRSSKEKDGSLDEIRVPLRKGR